MTALTAEVEEVHLVCCRDAVALCGRPARGGDTDVEESCVDCMWSDQMGRTCGAWFCRLRQWWRNRRWLR